MDKRTFENLKVSELEEDLTEKLIQTMRENRATIDELRRELEKAKAGPAISERDSGPGSPESVPEGAAGFGDECEDQECEAGDLPPTPPPPCDEGPLQTAPCVMKTPTVFIGSVRDGEAAEYDETDSSTREQDG